MNFLFENVNQIIDIQISIEFRRAGYQVMVFRSRIEILFAIIFLFALIRIMSIIDQHLNKEMK